MRGVRVLGLLGLIGHALSGGTFHASATETEHLGMRVLPAPGGVAIDGQAQDWDLSGGIFAVNDVENLREPYGVWFHMMYDKDRVYVLARWNDPEPLNNPGSSKGDMGFQGDCLQVRFIAEYGVQDRERVSHWTCWRDRDGIGILDVAYGRDFKQAKLRDAQEHGAAQAFALRPDGKGYLQEIAIPWALLTLDGTAPKPGSALRMAIEPNYTAGALGRVSIKDIFQPNTVPDRVFTFRSYPQWGSAVLESKGPVEPWPVRLADGREIPVRMEAGVPVADWSTLAAGRAPTGFLPIRFSVPADGYVSLNLYDREGIVVRQLLNWSLHAKGEHTVLWDALTTPQWRTPGTTVAEGDYTWKALFHPGIGLRLRGWASNGGRAPWDSGPTSNWGGDHGVPAACATDGESVYLGWTGAEAGKALVACDLNGNVRWKQIRGGMGGAGLVAVDGGIVYAVDHDKVLYRVEAATGRYSNWEGEASSDRFVADMWKDRTGMPDRIEGLAAVNGQLLVTCSSATFRSGDVRSWPSLLARVLRREGLAAKVFDRLSKHWRDRAERWGKGLPNDWEKVCASPNYFTPSLQNDVLRVLNLLLREAEGPAPDAATLSGDARAQANRRAIEAAFEGEFLPTHSNFIAVLDGRTGKEVRRIDVDVPRAVHGVRPDLAYVVCQEGSSVVAVNPQTGSVRPVVTGLRNARGVTTDPAGNLWVSVAEPLHQILGFTPEGKATGTIGRQGGRPALGPWQDDGMRQPAGLAVDPNGRLWVAETTMSPKRISVWTLADGALWKELFGPTHYGASGGAVNPLDPSLMAGEGCEWRIDPATGRGTCLGVFEDQLHDAARYAVGANGKVYLATAEGRGGDIEVRERLGDGAFALRTVIHPDRDAKTTTFWSDADGDGQRQPHEVQVFPSSLGISGWWYHNLNTDLSLYAANGRTGLLFRVSDFTACGAPRYALDAPHALPALGGSALGSPDNRRVLSVEAQWFKCFEVETGRLLWTYPNTFAGVHGSHRAPPPEPGLTRGAFSIVGAATLPKPIGAVWAINGNCGEWYVLTEDGFFLTQLFQGDPFKQQFPESAVPGAVLDQCPPGLGGEDFGGSFTQTSDGTVVLQAGKTGLWNVEVVGLDKVVALQGAQGIHVGPSELEQARQAREAQLQSSSGSRAYTVNRGTPDFQGALDTDFSRAERIRFEKQAGAGVRAAALRDDTHLYVGWEVQDTTPWVNGADAPEFLYARGDTVDLQLGTDPSADGKRKEPVQGDLRLSIGNFSGRPTAVVYRKVAHVKQPRTFSSGVVQAYVLDSVRVLSGVDIKVNIQEGKRYTVEAAIPLSELGVSPSSEPLKLRGDFGATHGDATGTDTALRTHWSNQETGLVNDEVFELRMEPANWGGITLRP